MPQVARGSRTSRRRLGELLVEDGLLSREQLYAVLHEQRQSGELLVEVLVRMGLLDEQALVQSIIKNHNFPFISIKRYDISPEVSTTFPERLLRQYLFVPLDRMGPVLTVVMGTDPDANALSELERLAQCKVHIYVGLLSEVKETIDSTFAGGDTDTLSSLGSLLLGSDE